MSKFFYFKKAVTTITFFLSILFLAPLALESWVEATHENMVLNIVPPLLWIIGLAFCFFLIAIEDENKEAQT